MLFRSFPVYSPDGRWMAYNSDESGRFELYVRSVADDAAHSSTKRRISTEGGPYPVWSHDMRRIYFTSANLSSARILTADVAVSQRALSSGEPTLWADVPIRVPNPVPPFDMHPDGKRLVMFPAPTADARQASSSVHVNMLLNFFDELRRRVPVDK